MNKKIKLLGVISSILYSTNNRLTDISIDTQPDAVSGYTQPTFSRLKEIAVLPQLAKILKQIVKTFEPHKQLDILKKMINYCTTLETPTVNLEALLEACLDPNEFDLIIKDNPNIKDLTIGIEYLLAMHNFFNKAEEGTTDKIKITYSNPVNLSSDCKSPPSEEEIKSAKKLAKIILEIFEPHKQLDILKKMIKYCTTLETPTVNLEALLEACLDPNEFDLIATKYPNIKRPDNKRGMFARN